MKSHLVFRFFAVSTFLISLGISWTGTSAAGAAAVVGAPPPIPTTEERERFIAGHHAALPPLYPESHPRGVHDEYDVLHYDIRLDVDITARIITGTVEVLAVGQVSDLTEIILDFYDPMVVDSMTVGGIPAAFVHEDRLLTVTLDHAYELDDTLSVSCDFHGRPFFALLPFRWSAHDGVPMVLTYSEPYGAPAWWVCKDDPKDKATFAIHVTAPDTLSTVSNGYLDSVVDNGNGTATYNWITNYPMSTYLFSLAITNFESWTEVYTALDGSTTMNIDYFAYPEDMSDAQVSWSRNMEMMDFLAGLFGEYPFLNEKYAIAEFQHPGAMEHQTATSYGSGWIDGAHTNDYIVVHELSHSWVGDMITMTEWSHAWCKEGFATICEALYFEDLYGEEYYHAYMESLDVLDYAAEQLFEIADPLDSAIYYKGAWVLHMLRHVLGDTDFFGGIYSYTHQPDFLYAVANTDDMRDVFEGVSGIDLDWFFYQWIYQPGYPIYNVGWAEEPARDGHDVRVQIDQTQPQPDYPVFKMPIDILVETTLGDESFVVWDSLAHQNFTLHVEGEPTNLVLDPAGWLIKEVTTSTGIADEGDVGGELVTENFPNPFRPETSIRFTLPFDGPVSLIIYDVQGRRVRTLVDGHRRSGTHTVAWDATNSSGARVAGGTYYYRLSFDGTVKNRKMIVIE